MQTLFDEAESRLLGNLRDFAGRKVLVEGAGYEKIWLETQPMGGEMYAKRDLEAGLNNVLLFMENIREDGRLPGSIKLSDAGCPGNGKKIVVPEFNKLQGFCFADAALNLYYLAGEDREYLNLLGSVLSRFDRWLWATRDSDDDGCLESFCVYDTGEDGAVRYLDAPNYWESDAAPTEFRAVPMASVDVMSWSYSCRNVLSKIWLIKGDCEKAEDCALKAASVRKRMEEYLWNSKRHAFFDRYKDHKMQNVLTHGTLKAMYFGAISADNAAAFVGSHLMNANEFNTRMPIPSVSVSDPMFRNISENNWSGQSEALTLQRAIRALENYGYYGIIPYYGKKLFGAVSGTAVSNSLPAGNGTVANAPGQNSFAFVQQFDPFTGKPSLNDVSGGSPTYGPNLLSVLEYMSRMFGVHRERNLIYWGTDADDDCEYTQILNNTEYKIIHSGNRSVCCIDGKTVFDGTAEHRLITDVYGKIMAASETAADNRRKNEHEGC